MDRDRALAELPFAHAVALRLQAAGAGHQTIADALGIDTAGVPALLQVAQAKLAAELARNPGPAPAPDEPVRAGHPGRALARCPEHNGPSGP